MTSTEAATTAVPGWYPWHEGGVRHWDGTSWSGRTRESAPSTPWTSWLALALVLGAFAGESLSGFIGSYTRLPPSVFRVADAAWLIGAVLAGADVVRGRRRRLPLGVAVVTLILWLASALTLVLFLVFFAFVMGV